MENRRIYSLDFFKLLLAYVVALHHIGVPVYLGAELAVEFFFILSGFYLARKFYSSTFEKGSEGLSSWDYTLNHAKSVYPQFLFAMVVYILYELARYGLYWVMDPSMGGLLEIVRFLYDQIPEILLLHCSYQSPETLLYPTWQLSAILISGYFLYELLRQNEKLTRRILLPASVMMVQGLLHSGVGLFDNYGFFLVPLLRAFSSMGMGVLTWYFLQTKYCRALFSHSRAANLFSLYAIAMLALFQCRFRIYLVTVPFLILLMQDEGCWINRILNRRCFRSFGRLSLAVFVNHSLICRMCLNLIMYRFGTSLAVTSVLYLVILTVYSVFTVWAVDRITALYRAKRAVAR